MPTPLEQIYCRPWKRKFSDTGLTSNPIGDHRGRPNPAGCLAMVKSLRPWPDFQAKVKHLLVEGLHVNQKAIMAVGRVEPA